MKKLDAKKKIVKLQLNLPGQLVEALDALIKEEGYASRAEALKVILTNNAFLKEEKRKGATIQLKKGDKITNIELL